MKLLQFYSDKVKVAHSQSIGLRLGYDNPQNSYEGNQSQATTT